MKIRLEATDGNRIAILEFATDNISDMLVEFENFLKACSFELDGYVGIITGDGPQPQKRPSPF